MNLMLLLFQYTWNALTDCTKERRNENIGKSDRKDGSLKITKERQGRAKHVLACPPAGSPSWPCAFLTGAACMTLFSRERRIRALESRLGGGQLGGVELLRMIAMLGLRKQMWRLW
jgi:hypothetical protein